MCAKSFVSRTSATAATLILATAAKTGFMTAGFFATSAKTFTVTARHICAIATSFVTIVATTAGIIFLFYSGELI
jgi:hypothetical protein